MAGVGLQPTKESGNFFRLSTLLIDGGAKVLRVLLSSCYADEPKPDNTLVAFLRKHNSALYQLKQQNVTMIKANWGKLFPPSGTKPPSESDFDPSLLCCLLLNICKSKLTKSETADVTQLRTLRNVLYGHCNAASVDDVDFHVHWPQIRDILLRLAHVCSADFRVEVDCDVTDLEKAALDTDKENELIQVGRCTNSNSK
jgi:hypothetical protein